MSTFAQKYTKEVKNNNKNFVADKSFTLDKFQELCQKYDCTATETEVGVYTDWIMKHRETLMKSKNENIANGIADFHEYKKRLHSSMGMSANIFDYEPKDMPNIHFKCNEIRNSKLSVSQSAELSNYEGEYTMEHQGKDWWVIRSLTFNAELFFGDNTAWCTRGSETWFNKYSDEGYMICVPLENGKPNFKSSGRYQFHISDSCQFYCCNTADRYVGFDSMPKELQEVINIETERKREQVKEKYRTFTEVVTRTIATQLGIEQVPTRRKNQLCFKVREGLFAYFDETNLSLTLSNGKHNKKVAECNTSRSIYANRNNCLNVEVEVAKYCDSLKSVVRIFSPSFLGDYKVSSFDINGVKGFIDLTLTNGQRQVYFAKSLDTDRYKLAVKPFEHKKSFYWSNNHSSCELLLNHVDGVLDKPLHEYIEQNYDLMTNINEFLDFIKQKKEELSAIKLCNYSKKVTTKKGNVVTIDSYTEVNGCVKTDYQSSNVTSVSMVISFYMYANDHKHSSMYSIKNSPQEIVVELSQINDGSWRQIVSKEFESFVKKMCSFYSMVDYLYPNGFTSLKQDTFETQVKKLLTNANLPIRNKKNSYWQPYSWHWANIRS